MKFNKTSIAAISLPHGKSEHFEWDDEMPGFGIRLRGKKATWVVGYRVGAQQRRESLGDIRKVPLEGARKAAQNRFAQVKLGVDPGAKKEIAKAEALKTKLLFSVAVEQFLDYKKGMIRPSTYTMTRYDLTVLCAPFKNLPVESITLRHVAELLKDIVREAGKRSRTRHIQGEARAGRIMAKRARGHLSGFFKWAMGEGLATSNPVISTNDPGKGIGNRNRVLIDDELRAIWHAAGDGDAGNIVKLLILNGCRRCEISGLRWDEVDMRGGTITLEDERTKNGQTLKLALAPLSLEILDSIDREKGKVYVFGTRGRPFTNWSYAIGALHNRVMADGHILKRWTLHDLRRTMRTGMGRLGIPPHIAERVINHVQPGIVKIYDHYDYAAEIKQALLIWEAYVRKIIGMTAIEGSQRKIGRAA